MKSIKPGQPAPNFTLPKQDGSLLSLKDLVGKQVVLFFYPKDNTPGCTIESRGFSAALSKFERRNTVVVGISGGTTKTKTAFCQKFQLRQAMLSDTDFAVASAYGSYGERSFMGRKYMGILRKTFVIDVDGTISKIFDKVNPEEHAQEVLAYVTALNKSAVPTPLKTRGVSVGLVPVQVNKKREKKVPAARKVATTKSETLAA